MVLSVLGVHPVAEAAEACHLIELRVDGCDIPFDVGSVTQEHAGRPRSSWPLPYDEHALNPEGTRGKPCFRSRAVRPDGTARVAFFFHHLDVLRPLLTPAGPVPLPPETSRPERLRFMKYEQP